MGKFYEGFLIPSLVENGLDGLECSYPEHTVEQRVAQKGFQEF